jgi:hypothetical protein
VSDDFARLLLTSGVAAEAFAWLSTKDGIRRTLGELATAEASLALVAQLYAAGAKEVTAVQIRRSVRETLAEDDVHENTGHLVVELPEQSAERKAVFRLRRREARRQGYDPTTDAGQGLLYIKLD